jgi:hypothetical protein
LGGSPAFVSVPSYAALDVGDGPLTIELWVKRARTNQEETLISKGAGAYEITIAKNGFVQFGRAGGRTIAVSSVKIADTTSWHHVAVTRNASAAAIYLDGSNVTGRVTPQTLTTTGLPLTIGISGSTAFNGSVDEVAVYSTALNAVRIQAHFAATR